MSYVGIPTLMDDEERARRMAAALLSSLDTWLEQVDEIAIHATPGNRVRALHLMRSMLAAKQTLRNIAGLPEDG